MAYEVKEPTIKINPAFGKVNRSSYNPVYRFTYTNTNNAGGAVNSIAVNLFNFTPNTYYDLQSVYCYGRKTTLASGIITPLTGGVEVNFGYGTGSTPNSFPDGYTSAFGPANEQQSRWYFGPSSPKRNLKNFILSPVNQVTVTITSYDTFILNDQSTIYFEMVWKRRLFQV